MDSSVEERVISLLNKDLKNIDDYVRLFISASNYDTFVAKMNSIKNNGFGYSKIVGSAFMELYRREASVREEAKIFFCSENITPESIDNYFRKYASKNSLISVINLSEEMGGVEKACKFVQEADEFMLKEIRKYAGIVDKT